MGASADRERAAINLADAPNFKIGPLHVRPSSRQVISDGSIATIEPRVMQALVVLGTHSAEVVSRDQLVTQCWSGRAVGEDAINRCIAKVRRLGEASGAFEVETVPRVGYRLIETAREQTPAGMDRRTAIAIGTAALVAAGVGGWELLKPRGSATGDSIAVLPFKNLSGDPNQAYFSDGVAEEIRNALTRLPGLKVIGRGSSEAVRSDDPREAAAKLGVATILTGSVRRSPTTMRITAELIDGRTGVDKWSQDYDRAPGDAIAIQTEIAANVVNALRIALGSTGQAVLTLGGTSNPEAQDLLFRTQAIENFSKAGNQQRLGLIERVIALDPSYAKAYAEKAETLAWFARWFPHSLDERAGALADARRAATRAVELAPAFPDAHAAMSAVLWTSLSLSEALREMRQAIALAPNRVEFLGRYSFYIAMLGNAGEALRIIDKAIALDPLSVGPRGQRVFVLYLSRRYIDAMAQLRLIPKNAPPPIIASAFILLGRDQEAKGWLEKVAADSPLRLDLEAMMLARSGDRSGALAKRNRVKQLYGDAANYEFAKIDAQLHDTDQAIADLERAWANKEPDLSLIRVEPWLDPIRADPRFAALVSRMDLPNV
jgi:TolB-like protein/DNA-binding winged helix-turn-helix (wHTH) protein/tetratricopeptide (TPR) repeat protein